MMETDMATLIPAMVIPLLLAMAILPHHMDTLMDTTLPATALLFMDINLLMAQLPLDKIHLAMDMPHLLQQLFIVILCMMETAMATLIPAMVIPLLLAMAILPHHMDTAPPSTALLFINMNLLMGQLPMDTLHQAMDMPHLLLKDTVLATVTPATDMY